jgi:hypothetical protein
MPTKKTKPVYRDSDSGRFTPKENVRLHPERTETERRPVVSIRRRPQGALAGSRWQGRCGQAACWAVWLSRAAFQFQGSRAWIWCTG